MPSSWQFWRSGAASGDRNMAIDSALLDRASDASFGVFRCYGWSEPTITVGRNEVATDRFDLDFLRDAGIPLVRRATGGRTLYHASEVTYSVTIPLQRSTSWRRAYDGVNSLLRSALCSMGVDATIVSDTIGADDAGTLIIGRSGGSVCFSSPNPGEITVSGSKLVGSAVWRTRRAFLQQGSILVSDHQDVLARACRNKISAPPPAAGLASLLSPELSGAEISSALEDALEEALSESASGTVTPFVTDASFMQTVNAHESIFQSHEWLWRR